MTRNGRRGLAERTGLYIAATMAGIFILLVLVFAIRGGGGASGQAFDDAPDLPPGVEPLTSPVGSGMYVELADKDDPTRRAGLITAESVEPLGPKETSVTQPRVWYYLRDGRTLHVEAAKGRFYFPSGQTNSAPESGNVQGNVVIRVFDPIPGGERPVIGRDVPILTATSEEPLEFDLRNARIATTGRVVIKTPQAEFAGSYLTAVVNQVKERLELLEVRKGEYITLTPSDASETANAEPAHGDESVIAIADAGEASDATTPTAPAPIKIDEYQIAFLDGVEISRATQRAWADKLDLWVRLRDNRLAPDAFGQTFDNASSPAAELASPDDAVTATDEEGTDVIASGETTPPEASAAPAPDPRLAPITLRWTGPLVVKPLNTSPTELDGTDLAFRLTAEKTGLVKGEDPELGITGHMVALEGRASTRELILSGPGGTIDLDWQGTGRYIGSRAMVSFSAGTIHSRGPTVLEGVLDPGATGGSDARGKIRCTEQADFQFSVVDGAMTSDLESATFLGDVEATDGEAKLEGADALTAIFIPTDDGSTRLAQLEVEGGRATDSRGQSAAGDSMRIEFSPGTHGEELDPTRFVADGAVRLASPDTTLNAEHVDADLSRGPDGDIVTGEVYAAGAVEYAGPDKTWAKADEMRGDGVLQRVTVLGSPAQVGKGGALISGFEIDLDAIGRGAEVFGPGRFEKDDSVAAPDRLSGIAWASWEEGMVFDDFAGRIELTGNAKAESRPDPLTLDSLSADRVMIEFTPLPEPGSSSEGVPGVKEDRKLLRVRAYGRAGPVATKASVETRVYAADAPERAEQVYFLAGAQIDADAVNNTLHVPSAGKMLSLDRRPEPTDTERPEGLPLIARGPGQALITWEGSMSLERATGQAHLQDSTRIVHQSLLDGRYTELEAEDLMIRFRELGEQKDAGTLRGELEYADASGFVYFRNGSREMVADHARYDAQQGELFATAGSGNSVTVFDASRPAPLKARTMRWDLIRDRIDINAPSSAGVPTAPNDAP